MRSAICISGLARTYHKTHASFMANVVAPLRERGDVDIFISTWDTIDIRALSPRPVEVERTTDEVEIRGIYEPVALEVQAFIAYHHAFRLRYFTNRRCPEPSVLRNGLLIAAPAQFKVWRCNELKRRQEEVAGWRYDLVLRTRFDFDISRLDMSTFNLDRINCLYNHDQMIGDYFYAGPSNQMDRLCEVYPNYPFLLHLHGTDMGPEHILRNQADHHGLQTHVLEGYTFALVRDTTRQEYRWDTTVKGYRPYDITKGAFA